MEKVESIIRSNCGTYAGYKKHRKHNEVICPECRVAMNEYRRAYHKRAPHKNAQYKSNYLAKPEKKAMLAEYHKKYNALQQSKLRAKKIGSTPGARQSEYLKYLKREDRKLQTNAAKQARREASKAARALQIEQNRQNRLEAKRLKSLETQARLAAKYQAMNEAREAREAAKKAETARQREEAREATKARKEAEKAEKRQAREAVRAELAKRHGVSVGDYDRCRKLNGTACDPCKKVVNAYVRTKWATDPKYKAAEKAWKKLNGSSIYRDNRDRALKHGVATEYYTRKHIINAWGTDCHICNEPVDFEANPIQGQDGWELYPHMDHVIPISKGGPDLISNIKLAHAKCNIDKGANLLEKATD